MLEVLMAVSISTVIAYATFATMHVGDEHSQAAEMKMTMQDSAREGTYKMAQEIRLSAPDRVTLLNDGAGIQFEIPDSDNPYNEDYTINWDNAHTITYELGGTDDQQIIRTDVTTDETSVVANKVASLDFEEDDSIITVTMGVQGELRNGQIMAEEPMQISAQAELRNT